MLAAERPSAESNGLNIALLPDARDANATARIEWDFEPGTPVVPLAMDGLTDSIMMIVVFDDGFYRSSLR